MLAGPPQAAPGGMHGSADGARGGEHLPSRGFSGRPETVGLAYGAGTSRSRGQPAARHGEGGSSSDADEPWLLHGMVATGSTNNVIRSRQRCCRRRER